MKRTLLGDLHFVVASIFDRRTSACRQTITAALDFKLAWDELMSAVEEAEFLDGGLITARCAKARQEVDDAQWRLFDGAMRCFVGGRFVGRAAPELERVITAARDYKFACDEKESAVERSVWDVGGGATSLLNAAHESVVSTHRALLDAVEAVT